jgi:hypothetical protein
MLFALVSSDTIEALIARRSTTTSSRSSSSRSPRSRMEPLEHHYAPGAGHYQPERFAEAAAWRCSSGLDDLCRPPDYRLVCSAIAAAGRPVHEPDDSADALPVADTLADADGRARELDAFVRRASAGRNTGRAHVGPASSLR